MAKQQPAPDESARSVGTGKSEEQASWQGMEEGRIPEGYRGAVRPARKSRPRDVTSINPADREPVDPESPFLIPA